MKITIEIPDAHATEIIDAYCAANSYEAIIGMDADGKAIPNPQSKQEFFEARIFECAICPAQEERLQALRENHKAQEEREQSEIADAFKAQPVTTSTA